MAERVHVVGVLGGVAAGADLPASPSAVMGAPRLLDLVADRWPNAPRRELADLDTTLATVAQADGEVVVVASGDPGWLGIARSLMEHLGRDRIVVHPAVSSVAAAFARAGVPWDDARVVSAHGRDPHPAVALCLAHHKVAVLTEPRFGPAELAAALQQAGCAPREVTVVERIGHPDEAVIRTDLAGAAALTATTNPNVVVVLDPARRQIGPRLTLAPPPDVPDRWALPTDRFTHRDGMISKPEVRALALAHLAPAAGRLLWDVGTGSGSVAVEAARFGAAVIAVDRDAAACARAARNAAEHGVAITTVHGAAPAVLAALPAPDAVFVGGGGETLDTVVGEVARRARDRIVVTLATVERTVPALDRLTAAGWRAAAQLVQVSELQPLGGGHRLAPHNPVFLVHAERHP